MSLYKTGGVQALDIRQIVHLKDNDIPRLWKGRKTKISNSLQVIDLASGASVTHFSELFVVRNCPMPWGT